MTSTIVCPHCRIQVQQNPQLAGRKVACPKCGGQFQMPGAEPPPVVTPQNRQMPPVVTPPVVQPSGQFAINTGPQRPGPSPGARPSSLDPKTVIALGVLAVVLLVPCCCAGLLIVSGEGHAGTGGGGAPSSVLTSEEWVAFRNPVSLSDMSDRGVEFRWVNESNGYFYKNGKPFKSLSYQDGKIMSVSLHDGDTTIRSEFFYPDGSTEELHENHRYTHFFPNGQKEWELVTGEKPYAFSPNNRYWDKSGKELSYEQYCEQEYGPDWQEKVSRWSRSDIDRWKQHFDRAMKGNR